MKEKNEDILVSIIIPVYNVAPFLIESLNSVINQTYKNLEIIIVNDGSSDGSEIICSQYEKKDKRIRLINQENKGLSAARNVGLDIMTGEYVAFLDSDDTYHKNFIETMVSLMYHSNADVVICQYIITKSLCNSKYGTNIIIKPDLEDGILNRTQALRALIDNKLNFGVWNKLYKRKLWDALRFPYGRVYEEIETTCKIFDSSHIVCTIRIPLYFHNVRSGSITTTNSMKNVEDWIIARTGFEKFVCDNIPNIFSKDQLQFLKELRLKSMMLYYIQLSWHNCTRNTETLRKQIIDVGNEINTKRHIRFTVAWIIIKYFPQLVPCVYPIYTICKALKYLR